MQSTNSFDERIRETLSRNAERVIVSKMLKNRIDSRIVNQKIREESSMKRMFSIKKVAVIAAILCFMIPVSAYAISNINSYVTVSGSSPVYSELPTASQLSLDLGFVPKTIDSFANGFSFQSANISNAAGLDESGSTLEKFKEISYTYASVDGQTMSLSISAPPISEEATSNPNAKTSTYNGIDLTYSVQEYRLVPADYQLTDEDEAKQASGTVVFSYGSDKVETSMMKFLCWSDGGFNYLLMGQNSDLSEVDFVDMAKEIINQ